MSTLVKFILIFQLLLINSTFAHFINIKKVIGPYPANGSIEEQNDFDILHNYQKNRTHNECELAKQEEKITLKAMFGGVNGILTKKEIHRFAPIFTSIQIKSGIYSYLAKKIYHRPRPYLKDQNIAPCIKRLKSYAYPSGHAMIARYTARVLAVYFPEKEKKLLDRADQIATNRVLGGVHHPSDIVAGKKLGDALAKNFFKKINN